MTTCVAVLRRGPNAGHPCGNLAMHGLDVCGKHVGWVPKPVRRACWEAARNVVRVLDLDPDGEEGSQIARAFIHEFKVALRRSRSDAHHNAMRSRRV